MQSWNRCAAAALLVLGCSTGSSPDSEPRGSVAVQQQRWEAAGLDDYRYDFQQQCFCVREQVQPVTIEVRGGRVVRVVSRETGRDITGVQNLTWHTIADLFRVIAQAQENAVTPLVVRYDPRLGYPTHIEAGSLAADAGIIYSASNLQPLAR